MTHLGILIGAKGRGSNMQAIADACTAGELPARVGVVVSPRVDAPAVWEALRRGLSVSIVEPGDDYGPRLVRALTGCTWVCLAGFTRLLPAEVLRAFPDRVVNIHPALLPKFGGKGMYGMHVHRAVLNAGETETGCTVHLVSDRYDEGPIVLQARCPVRPDDTPESLAARVLELEHRTYVEALKRLIEGSG